MRLKNETAIITGSTSGIGKKIAELFLKEGSKVTICSRSEDKVNNTLSEFRETFGDSVIGFPCDVNDLAALKNTVDQTISSFGSIRILVANAGLNLTYGPFYLMSSEMVDSAAKGIISTNLIGVMNSVAAVFPQMVKQGYGRIITLSGAGAERPFPNMTIYSASKGGVVAFSKCLAQELAERKDDIKINIFLPGMVKTNLGASIEYVPGGRSEEEIKRGFELALEYLGADLESSCSKVIPYVLPKCKANGKAFRGYSIFKVIRGGIKMQRALKKTTKKQK